MSSESTKACAAEVEKPKDLSARWMNIFETSLAPAKVKKAGTMLFDGVCFNLFDFSFLDAIKLKRILTKCGGWCTDLDENVTHIICYDEADYDDITKQVTENHWEPTLVKIEWVIECIDKDRLLPLTKVGTCLNLPFHTRQREFFKITHFIPAKKISRKKLVIFGVYKMSDLKGTFV